METGQNKGEKINKRNSFPNEVKCILTSVRGAYERKKWPDILFQFDYKKRRQTMSKYFGVIIFHYEFSERLNRTTERKNIRSVCFF